MSEGEKKESEADKGPWWARILEKNGIATVISIVFLYIGYEGAQRHFKLVDTQIESLQTIARSNIRQEQVMDKVINTLEDGNREHQHLIEKLK